MPAMVFAKILNLFLSLKILYEKNAKNKLKMRVDIFIPRANIFPAPLKIEDDNPIIIKNPMPEPSIKKGFSIIFFFLPAQRNITISDAAPIPKKTTG
ncbi:hypothetical protein GCM10022228_11240 [Halomonas cibimaris]|uniref:Uncharacterized protein n=1 Tax=Halomonas cibimaris TaxID=657012 RepID=A0ABP7LKB1_9GAMM